MINDSDASKRRPDSFSYSLASSKPAMSPPAKPIAAASDDSKKDAALIAAAAHATIPSWTNMVLMVSLIFGGCCANVSVQLELDEQ